MAVFYGMVSKLTQGVLLGMAMSLTGCASNFDYFRYLQNSFPTATPSDAEVLKKTNHAFEAVLKQRKPANLKERIQARHAFLNTVPGLSLVDRLNAMQTASRYQRQLIARPLFHNSPAFSKSKLRTFNAGAKDRRRAMQPMGRR